MYSKQDIDVMLSLVSRDANKEWINLKHIPLKVFCKLFHFRKTLSEIVG